MIIRFVVLYLKLTVLMLCTLGTLGQQLNPLSGQHLRVLAMEFPVSFTREKNATGHIVHVDGIQVHMLETLGKMLNFSYSYLPNTVTLTDDTPSARGGISYLINGEADYFLSTTILVPSRYQKADFPASWYYGPISTLMPYPQESLNLAASFKPLSHVVWILIGVAAFTTIISLRLLQKWETFNRRCQTENNREAVMYRESALFYVMGNLVSQGQHYFPKRLGIRIAAGAWCCTSFFLVQIYCCTLTSHLTSPNQKPLVNSFFEIADTPGVVLTYDKGFAIDQMLNNPESPENMKRFVGTLKKENRLMTCNATKNCLKYLENENAVYSAPTSSLNVIIAADVSSNNGTCRYTRTKDAFGNSPLFTALPKNSPYTESMSIGILRLQESGLLDHWKKKYVPSASKCMKINERSGMPRLSMKHLSSAFVILIAGSLISLTAFITEIIVRSLVKKFTQFNQISLAVVDANDV